MEVEQGWSQILYHNQLLLIAPEVERSILLCVDVCTIRAWCTSFTLNDLTPEGSEIEVLPQWADCMVPTLHQASKTPLGWISGKLHVLPVMSAKTSMQNQGWKVPSGGSWVWRSSVSVDDDRGTDINPLTLIINTGLAWDHDPSII